MSDLKPWSRIDAEFLFMQEMGRPLRDGEANPYWQPNLRPSKPQPSAGWIAKVSAARGVPLEEILQQLGVEDIRRGRCACPLAEHSSFRPFSVDIARGFWYCHACSDGGDGIKLVMLARRVDFSSAVREMVA